MPAVLSPASVDTSACLRAAVSAAAAARGGHARRTPLSKSSWLICPQSASQSALDPPRKCQTSCAWSGRTPGGGPLAS
eukprot:2270016-Pyramimonas_sp.AAC.1